MEDGYKFKGEDMPDAILDTVLNMFAFHEAAIWILIDILDLPVEKKQEILHNINVMQPLRKDELLQSLYERLGKTPDIL